ncbi:MAG: MoxR family ATPase [Gammaproteobacteria bacterium]|nr:MoxR family ATPase [Gammaproteobacteria bacterium]
MSDLSERTYHGDGKQHYQALQDAWETKEPYIAPPPLIEAVNMALYLRRPLLLEGEPGCGKTQLAYAVAYELGYPLKTCYIRSTTRAQDLLYQYDAVKRLYDIQESRVSGNKPENDNGDKEKNILLPREEYLDLGELGEALALAQEDTPSVVLIDEIDKADIDFPNDLLLVLDKLQFEAPETREKGKKIYKIDALKGQSKRERKHCLPLIIITSNREKELPKPFLRRCLFYYIEFPKQPKLEDILKIHFEKDKEDSLSPLFAAALEKFWELRYQEKFKWRKRPGTSEFLDWVQILEHKAEQGKINEEKLRDTDTDMLPYLETLVKTQADLDALKKS